VKRHGRVPPPPGRGGFGCGKTPNFMTVLREPERRSGCVIAGTAPLLVLLILAGYALA
jgi:hypothetical protein